MRQNYDDWDPRLERAIRQEFSIYRTLHMLYVEAGEDITAWHAGKIGDELPMHYELLRPERRGWKRQFIFEPREVELVDPKFLKSIELRKIYGVKVNKKGEVLVGDDPNPLIEKNPKIFDIPTMISPESGLITAVTVTGIICMVKASSQIPKLNGKPYLWIEAGRLSSQRLKLNFR